MIVIDINSGLGNQMLAYCVVLSMQKANPDNNCFIESIIYEIPECNEVVSQWNGYELDRLFGIKVPNVKTLFSDKQWKDIVMEVRSSKFWDKKWNYPPVVTRALNNAGLHLRNMKGDYLDPSSSTYKKDLTLVDRLRAFFLNKTGVGAYIKQLYKRVFAERLKFSGAHPERLFLVAEGDIFTGMWLDFKFNGNRIEEIQEEILKSFVFPKFNTKRNSSLARYLDSCNSVFIHARRGDMLSYNGWCYKYGYFRRAVRYIKKHVDNPVFVFFTNSGSIEWCKDNAKIFGLDYSSDRVLFVDWNTGDESYRDMQLMSHCKHGIITNSTFGWWGAYLIQNPNKITISPEPSINTTYHC